eukprot:Em0016g395a
MWRLVYSKYKLSVAKCHQLQQLLNDHSYSCGANLHLGDEFKDVEIRDHACGDAIVKLYYSAGFEPVCVYCGCDQPFTSPEQYPQSGLSKVRPVSGLWPEDLWVYNTDELIRYPQRREQSSVVWSHFKVHKFHETKEKSGYEGFADKAWCDYCHKPFELRESSGEQEEASLTLAYKGRESTLIAKKGHIEQYFTAKSVPLIDNEHDTAMQLLAQAWYDDLLPPLLADSLSFNKFIACISRGSFRMPGRSKLTELIDDIYAKMLLRLKALLQQSTSVLLATDAAKMLTGDSYVAVTCHWISADWCLMSAVLGLSIKNYIDPAKPKNAPAAPINPTSDLVSTFRKLIPLCKLIDELGLEGPSEADWSAAKMLCQFLKPFQIVTDYLQGEKYPTLGSLSRKITQLMLYLSRPNPPHSWGLLNKTWVDLPTPVSSMHNFLLRDMKRHWHTGNVLLGMAAIVDPRHKSLEWLKPHQQHLIQQQLLDEMFAVAEIPIPDNDENNEDDAAVPPKLKHRRFEDCDFLDADEEESEKLDRNSDAPAHGLRREVKDEFDAWLLIPEVRQVNATSPIDPLACWKLHDSWFPRASKLARKYLAIPASSAPSELVFSRAKLIQQRQRWNLLPQRLEACVMVKHNAWVLNL